MPIKKFLKAAKAIEEKAARRKPEAAPPESHNHDESNWLISYADMMTLLCAFFIMLFSMAHLEEPKYDGFKKAIAEEFGGRYESPTENFGKYLTQIMQEAGVTEESMIKVEPASVSVTFYSTVFFDTLNAEIKPEGRTVLNKLIEAVSQQQDKETKQYKVVVEGHTDSRPIVDGEFASNWELSSARSSRIVRIFLEHGFSPDKMTAVGYADTRPVTPSRTPAGEWDEAALAKNRRVVIRILHPQAKDFPFPESNS